MITFILIKSNFSWKISVFFFFSFSATVSVFSFRGNKPKLRTQTHVGSGLFPCIMQTRFFSLRVREQDAGFLSKVKVSLMVRLNNGSEHVGVVFMFVRVLLALFLLIHGSRWVSTEDCTTSFAGAWQKHRTNSLHLLQKRVQSCRCCPAARCGLMSLSWLVAAVIFMFTRINPKGLMSQRRIWSRSSEDKSTDLWSTDSFTHSNLTWSQNFDLFPQNCCLNKRKCFTGMYKYYQEGIYKKTDLCLVLNRYLPKKYQVCTAQACCFTCLKFQNFISLLYWKQKEHRRNT